MRSSALLLFAGLAASLPTAAEATPASIANGSFATPKVTGSFATYGNGSTAIPGWTVSGSVDLIGSYWQAPPGGGQSVDLDGNAPGGLTQTLATMPGQSYVVSFYLSGNPDAGSATKSLTVSTAAASQSFTYTIGGNTHADMKYVLETFAFTASGASTALSFTSNDAADSKWGPVIGNVAIPEPLSILMFGSALAGLGLTRRRAG